MCRYTIFILISFSIDVPQGSTVPYVQFSCGKTLQQSNAVIRLMARCKDNLYGKDWYENALVDQWLEYFKTEVENPVAVVNMQVMGYLPTDFRDFNMSSNLALQKLQAVD